MRIVSLLPSSTEIIYALGLEESLVGVTHECDYPPRAAMKPRVTMSAIPPLSSSAGIDFRVRQELENGGSLYQMNVQLLEELAPDIIFTQQLCTVCAVAYDNVSRAADALACKPRVINLEPTSVDGIFENIGEVGRLTDATGPASELVDTLRRRIERIRALTLRLERRRMLFLEWLDPPFCAGHWIPELIEFAGGADPFGRRHQPSSQLAWEQILLYNPDVVVISCCGFSVERTMNECHLLTKPEFQQLKASREENIFIIDGSSFFSRPGPRIVESLEILATILHPEVFPIDYPRSVVRQSGI